MPPLQPTSVVIDWSSSDSVVSIAARSSQGGLQPPSVSGKRQ